MDYKDRNNQAELVQFKNSLLRSLDNQLTDLIESDDDSDYRKAAKICYWIKDYIGYMDFEASFNPTRLPKYERGSIVKVNFGFRIGNEHGGLHYAVVIDNNNSIRSGAVTVVPLKSKKTGRTLHQHHVDLGSEIYEKIQLRNNTLIQSINQKLSGLRTKLASAEEPEAIEINSQIQEIVKEDKALKKIRKELSKMQGGSIALLDQVTTVSKMRIYDPQSGFGVLSGVKLSSEGLNAIDQKMRELFMK